GALANALGRPQTGARLQAVCWVIEKAIGHGDADKDLQKVLRSCSKMNYSEEQTQAMLEEVAMQYQQDRGQELLQEAFGSSAEAAQKTEPSAPPRITRNGPRSSPMS